MSKLDIVLIGFMGSGKTTIGREISRQRGLGYLDLDEEILNRLCFSTISDIFDQCGEAYFREQEARVFHDVLKHEGVVVATGGGIVSNLGATRDLEKAHQEGRVVYLKANFVTIERRLEADETRPLFRDHERARKLFDSRWDLYEKYANRTYVVDYLSVPEIVNAIVADISL
jgi:shikimate kinase